MRELSKTVSKEVKYFPVKHASFDIAENFLSSALYTIFVSIIMDTQTEKLVCAKTEIMMVTKNVKVIPKTTCPQVGVCCFIHHLITME